MTLSGSATEGCSLVKTRIHAIYLCLCFQGCIFYGIWCENLGIIYKATIQIKILFLRLLNMEKSTCKFELKIGDVITNHQRLICWFLGSSFKGFSMFFPAPSLAKVESSQKSNEMWFFRHFFAPYLFDRSRNNRRDKLRSKFWGEKMFRKPHLKLLR